MGLLERESYLEDLSDCLAAAAAGQGGVALILGEAGIGKTSLLRQFVQEQKTAKRVLWGGCEALFTPHPLAPLYDVARQIGGEFPAALANASDRGMLFNLAIDELARGPAPTILVIEDAHWADDATLDLIKFLGRRLHRLGVLLIITYRDDEVNPRHPLCSVVGDLPIPSVRRVQLRPLSEAAVAALAEEAIAQAADRSAAKDSEAGGPAWKQQDVARLHAITRLYEVTGGNPFFVTEVLAAAEGPYAETGVPPTVRDAVIARMARLSDPARNVVNLTSLVPGRIEGWLLDRCVPEAAAVLQECLAVGMVALPDGALAFRHELARRAAEEQLSAPQQRALHACILEGLLEHAGGVLPHADISHPDISLARVVHHADQAGDGAAVLRFAPAAAERAAALRSHREAAAHYATALYYAGSLPDERRAELFERRSYECYLTEQIAAAIAARESALALRRKTGDGLKEGDNLRWLSRLHWFNGNKAESDRHAKLAIACLTALPPGAELAMAYSNCAQLYMLADQAELALEWGGKAIALASQLNETEILSHAFNNVGAAKLHRLDVSGLADLELSLRLALDNGFEEHAARAYTNLASIAVRHYQLGRAARYLEDGIIYSETHDLESWGRYMTAFRARLHLLRGDWQAATDDAQSIIQHPRAATISKIPALVVLALVRARRGDPDVDRPLGEARNLALPTAEMQRIGIVTSARAEAAWLKGRGEEALEEIRAIYELARGQTDPWVKGELAAWLRRCGGTVDVDRDDLAEPFALQMAGDWRKAAAAWETLGCPYEQALALAESDDEQALRQALEICDRLGAATLALVVRRKLRASGVRGIARGAQERTRANPQGLTNSELKVLNLLAQGRRNAEIARRLFVSEKTVGHHVSAILAKLDVRSRGEAAAAAGRLGLLAAAETDTGAKVVKK
ncbi:MAG TPA: AAA family ATPase [Dongiaceae bacterium]|nr:AAA family ATPase [Dongiaceae bacterium]